MGRSWSSCKFIIFDKQVICRAKKKIMCQSRVSRPALRRGGNRRAYTPATLNASTFQRGGQRQQRSGAGMYMAGKPVDAINMKFQGDRSAFTRKAGRSGKLAANYNGKKFRPVQVTSEKERRAILSQCKPRSAEEEAWNNELSLAVVVDFYGKDPMESPLARDPVVQRVLRDIDAYSMGSSWADEDVSSGDEFSF